MKEYEVYGHFVTGYSVRVTAESQKEALEKGSELLMSGEWNTATDGSWSENSFEVRQK